MVRLHLTKSRPGKVNLLVFGLYLIVFSLLLPLAACSHAPGNKLYDPRQVDFTVQYNPVFDRQLYPSLILAGLEDRDESQLFSISVVAPTDGCVLRVVIDSSDINYVTYLQEVLPHRGETYTLFASTKWKYDVLRRLRQPHAVDLTFSCFINDEEVDIKNLRLNCRTVNECPLSFMHAGKTYDFRPLFAAYVNEDHPQIEQILTDIVDQGLASRFSGYQNGPKSVDDQVFAVWQYVLRRGITYSSISCTSNPSTTANVQHIRLFDEVWNTRQANCIDACVFFASILRKIGIRTVIFVEPCHAYLGYYSDKNRRHLVTLETTITSWVNLPELQRALSDSGDSKQSADIDKVSRFLSPDELQRWNNGQMTLDQLQTAVARSLFEKAKAYNTESYETNRQNFSDSSVIAYQQLDIEQLRKTVQPIR